MKYATLLEYAFQALKNSYAPYSRFRVGAALLSDDGEVVTGCNVENASYGLSMCAERTAVFRAVAQGVKKFDAIAVVSGKVNPVYPCGACRQVLREFNPRLTVVVAGPGKKPLTTSLDKLLPKSFGKESLRRR
ncbi:MAG: cytidine deaminase [Candidatus Caldarchaeum sp.]|uniref:cytidine deaminase n=1 Tax=Caldiarchaeum subterraneum TaxID=311458 RepID=A0A7C4I608_CALS0|nr:cytidine deaminase [Candidatus Caldarchaeales archaeon]MDJ0272398.1 cytidine deaminase [Candidatus Caldarchaeales archaeon]